MRYWFRIYLLFVCLKSTFAFAQELDSVNFSMNELIISADKFQEKRKDIPRQIDIINQKTIQQLNKQNMGDLLFEASNVYLQKSQQGGGSPIIRGFEANKILMVLDGVRLNNAIYRGGHLQNVLRIEQNIIERVEVLHGPGSLLYGSDALGGVLNFVTIKPSLDKPIQVYVMNRNSSVNQEKTQLITLQAAYKKLGVLFHYSQSDFGDLMQGKKRNNAIGELGLRPFFQDRYGDSDRIVTNPNPHKQVGSAYRQHNILTKWRYKPKAYSEHLLSYYYTTTGNIPRYDRLSEIALGKPRFAEWYYGPETFHFLHYQFNHSLIRTFWDELKLNISLQQVEESRNTRNFGNSWLNQRQEKVAVFAMHSDFKKRIKRNEIRYGLEYLLNQVNSTASAFNLLTNARQAISTRYPDGGSLVYSLGAYLTMSQEIGKKWVFTEGIRVNYNSLSARFSSKQFYSFLPNKIQQSYKPVSANVGLVFMPNAKLRLYANIGNAYRVPNVDDLGKLFDSRPGNILIVPNNYLKPEQTITYELGIEKRFNNKLLIAANAFYTGAWNTLIIKQVGSDSILYDNILTPVFTTQNAQRARIIGYHVQVNFIVNKYWKMEANLNQSLGTIFSDSIMPLDHIPPLYGRLAIHYSKKRWQASLQSQFSDAKHRSKYYLNGEDNIEYATANGLPAWYIISTNVGYSFFKNQALHLRTGIENILDRNYRTFASGISAPGRNFYLSLAYQLN